MHEKNDGARSDDYSVPGLCGRYVLSCGQRLEMGALSAIQWADCMCRRISTTALLNTGTFTTKINVVGRKKRYSYIFFQPPFYI